jgi:hypothetical protein
LPLLLVLALLAVDTDPPHRESTSADSVRLPPVLLPLPRLRATSSGIRFAVPGLESKVKRQRLQDLDSGSGAAPSMSRTGTEMSSTGTETRSPWT